MKPVLPWILCLLFFITGSVFASALVPLGQTSVKNFVDGAPHPPFGRECHLPKDWQRLCPILETRVSQTTPKMKLPEAEARALEYHLQNHPVTFLYLNKLQALMPKTTVELLMATYKRGLNKNEADRMAQYLLQLLQHYQFKNHSAFDNNTSHIIGREWHEIDYSGEAMTWQNQKKRYAPFGITHFKSLENLKKFFPVESKLPYFNKVYKPLQ